MERQSRCSEKTFYDNLTSRVFTYQMSVFLCRVSEDMLEDPIFVTSAKDSSYVLLKCQVRKGNFKFAILTPLYPQPPTSWPPNPK